MPKSKKRRKGTKGKGKRRKRKKGKKKKKKQVPEPPPLHNLTKLYNDLIDAVEEFKLTRNKARKKRIEAWYMTREMMSLRHDNDVYQKYLQEKMEDMENLMNEMLKQLQEEKDAVDKIVAKKMAEMDRIIAGYHERSANAELRLQELRTKLQEFESLMRELAGLMAKLKELQALIPIYELEANIKTRFLKNQFLYERSKLHNHLENELLILIETIRSHLMPVLQDHMTSLELENRCNRWELGRLDTQNFKLYRDRENLLERRNRLNIEREYLNIEWAFNRLHLIDARKKEKRLQEKMSKSRKNFEIEEEECELAIAFKAYLKEKLEEVEREKQEAIKAHARREVRQKRLQRDKEKRNRAESFSETDFEEEEESIMSSIEDLEYSESQIK